MPKGMRPAEFSVRMFFITLEEKLVLERVQDYECQHSASTEFISIGQYLITMFLTVFSSLNNAGLGSK